MIGIRTLKTGIGATITLLIATALGLKYATAASVITILSIQSTKKQSVEMAIKRLVATVIALLLATLVFNGLGFYALSFGVFLIIFIPIASKGNMVEGIVPASVLVTHFLGEGGITLNLFLNELALVVVGVIVALIINLYMPSVENEIMKCRHELEKTMYSIFENMACALKSECAQVDDRFYALLGQQIEEGKSNAYRYTNNYLFSKHPPFIQYFDMRKQQFQVMAYMKEHFTKFFMTTAQADVVARFTAEVAESVHGEKSAKDLLVQLEKLREDFRKSDLPKTREEFENRAMLYQFLNDIEHFLEIKQSFRESLTQEEFEEYKKGYAI
ncbi:aromatic acid exporter family protein [Niameybacter massiliensis]|uniref:Aromatic acid exporter family protein n=1 Tax=Holtiella tumoricola TaxID=3018743 RepID=A0AA42DQR2_9FIRM|nr:aromatic acid exporter family protein [Holtiella tumoricola]MDA3733450.1 aromatic acid exporter family protein [Holtiella tumoricola]